jgi:hypothetical protein
MVALLLSLAACGGMSVESAQDPAVDLTQLQSFEWMEREQPAVSRRATREGLDRRIREAVARELSAKGYQSASSGSGQLVLTYHVGLDGALDIQMVNTLPEDRWGIDRGWEFYTERSYRTLEQGTLVLDMYSAETGKLVWRGVAKAEIDRTQSPEKRAELVNEAVRKLLREFPDRSRA